MRNKKFEGWYFKHQGEEDTIAFIPGQAGNHSFIQMIDRCGSRQFDIPTLKAEHGIIHAGDCLFSSKRISIDLPNVNGEIVYGQLTPLHTDIMGPFKFLPMECRHSVISMEHTLSGFLTVDGEKRHFDGGRGYIEKDSGTSFPRSYLWLQCNAFSMPCSMMVSVAHIPFAGTSFCGCICSLIFEGQEYRLATYNGVQIQAAGPKYIRLVQGKLLLEIDIEPSDTGHPLRSPISGKMSGIIHESHQAAITCRFWKAKELIFDLYSNQASFEYVPHHQQ